MRFSFLFGLALLSWPLLASDPAPLNISEVSRRAELIVRGTVREKSIQRDSAGRIYTEIKLAVAEAWKGDPKSPTLKIVSAGGTLGELRDISVNEPSYAINEEVVAFLALNDRGEAVTLNKIRTDEKIAELKTAVKDATQ